jgi:hypothetical protein
VPWCTHKKAQELLPLRLLFFTGMVYWNRAAIPSCRFFANILYYKNTKEGVFALRHMQYTSGRDRKPRIKKLTWAPYIDKFGSDV